MTDSEEKQRALDASMENEGNRDLTPMVQISVKDYDKLKEQQHFITDKALIDIIDNMERLCKSIEKTYCKDGYIMDDRGPNDLERIIDDKDKIITHLKHDNKTLAKEVSDLIEEKKRLLDNQSNK